MNQWVSDYHHLLLLRVILGAVLLAVTLSLLWLMTTIGRCIHVVADRRRRPSDASRGAVIRT